MKLCECGCGEPTSLAKSNGRGRIKGQPLRFLCGHALIKRDPYYVDPETGCWVWTASCNSHGYAQTRRDGKNRRAGKWYYEQAKGAVLEGLTLDHLCCNKACVNPDHLEPVTNRVNVRRAIAKLDEDKVRAIRRSDASHASLGRQYGVTECTIREVRRRKTWPEVV